MDQNETVQTVTSQAFNMKPGDEVRMTNRVPVSMGVRVTTQCGAEFEVELHPGADFRLQIGNAPVTINILPGDNGGLQAVSNT